MYQNPYDAARNGGIGEYQLIYDTVGGVAHQPVKRESARNIVNLRADKVFRLSGGRRFTLAVDAFNAFNTNVAWGGGGGSGSGISDVSGPTYGYVVRTVYPRVLHLGFGYEF